MLRDAWAHLPRRNRAYAAATALYVAVLYGTLAFTPPLVYWLRARVGHLGLLLTALGILLCGALGLAWHGRHTLRGLSAGRAAGLAALAAGYAVATWWPESPASKLHLLLYGVLAWLLSEALHGRLTPRLRAACALAIIMAVGAGDEGIQWLLPNRYGLLEDVALNWAAGALALATLALLRGGRERCALRPGREQGCAGPTS